MSLEEKQRERAGCGGENERNRVSYRGYGAERVNEEIYIFFLRVVLQRLVRRELWFLECGFWRKRACWLQGRKISVDSSQRKIS